MPRIYLSGRGGLVGLHCRTMNDDQCDGSHNYSLFHAGLNEERCDHKGYQRPNELQGLSNFYSIDLHKTCKFKIIIHFLSFLRPDGSKRAELERAQRKKQRNIHPLQGLTLSTSVATRKSLSKLSSSLAAPSVPPMGRMQLTSGENRPPSKFLRPDGSKQAELERW